MTLFAANYELNIRGMETDKSFRTQFKSLFRQPEAGHKDAPKC